jgi:arylsulfatase A-like enzyme
MQKRTQVILEAARQIGMAVVLATAFLILCYIRVLGDAGSAAFGGKIIDAALAGPIWGTRLGDNLITFGLTQLAVHIGFAFLCLGLAHLSKVAWPRAPHSVRTLFLLWFTMGAGWVLVANAALFRWSSLGGLYAEYVTATWRGLNVFLLFSGLIVAALAWTAIRLLWRLMSSPFGPMRRWLVPVAIVTSVTGLAAIRLPAATSAASPEKPHIIIIGLDSLRVDAVRKSPTTNTPAIDGFLNGAINFSNATTPLARTFPAWVSMITGRHPHTTGAVINLLPREMIQTDDTLPTLLARNGYRSIYAIDEVRFSNLDRSYGFDEMIAPPIGATDFLLGFFADAPLSNLLANSWLGEVLFPYTHANRAAAITYDPDSFVNRLDRRLQFDRPTFLAAHLTLAHWPYTWADATTEPDPLGGNAQEFYDKAVARLDRQFADLLRMLEKRGALENAIVIVLSDHGESLGHIVSGSRAGGDAHEHKFEFEEARLAGHGTSVFSPHQYHVLFAVKSIGKTPLASAALRTIDSAASLEDITPTVLDLLALPAAEPVDGISLFPLLSGEPASERLERRIRFTETEFNPAGVGPGQIISGSAMWSAAAYYRVDPETDRVLVRRERLQEVLTNRQYAAFRSGKLLAVVPASDNSGAAYRPFLRVDGQPPIALSDPAAHADPDVVELWTALQIRFPSLAGARGADVPSGRASP